MAEKLWGGRFSKETEPLVEQFTKSIQYDKELLVCDILGSIIHVKVLEKSGYLEPQEADSLLEGLDEVLKSSEQPSLDEKCEDIHTYIQNILQDKLGEVALKLHMARSRNDQVVFSTKVYCKIKIVKLKKGASKLISSIDELISKNSEIIIPGFTHLQHAQPVYLKDYLGAYTAMLRRDNDRLDYISKNIKIMMGAGALAGTPIDAAQYNINVKDILEEFIPDIKEALQIEPTENSLDSVSDRDFVIEIISALSIVAMHLSRLAEDLIIWSTKEFDFIEIDESYCTGSSLMPQKKNPDVLELIRGYAGRLYGNLISVMTMMKGLPLTYNRDMQLDKEPLFNSFELILKELNVLSGLISTLKFNELKIKEHLKDESLYATDLVYYLVSEGVPFKKAHTIIGELVRYSIDREGGIQGMQEEELKNFSDKIKKSKIMELFDPKHSVESKTSIKRTDATSILGFRSTKGLEK